MLLTARSATLEMLLSASLLRLATIWITAYPSPVSLNVLPVLMGSLVLPAPVSPSRVMALA